MTPKFLAWATRRKELLFTEMGQATKKVVLEGENEFSFEMSIRYPNGEVM